VLWPLTVAFVLAGALIFALAVPVYISVSKDGDGQQRPTMRIDAFFGLVAKELAFGSRKRREPERAARGERGVRNGRRVAAFVQSPGLLHRACRYAASIQRAIRVRELAGVARIGLDDPADTGELWGVAGVASALLARRYPGFAIEPSFASEEIDIEGRCTIAVVPLELLATTVAFALSPPFLRAAIAAWRVR
jgi:hypothetical protein